MSNDLEMAYWDEVDRRLNDSFTSDEERSELLDEQYKRIDEFARDEVISQVLDRAMNNYPGGGSSGSTGTSGKTSNSSGNPSMVHAITNSLQNAAIPAATAATLASQIAPAITSAGSGTLAAGAGLGPAALLPAIIFPIISNALSPKDGSRAVSALMNDGIIDTKSLSGAGFTPKTFSLEKVKKIGKAISDFNNHFDLEKRRTDELVAKDTQIGIDEELSPKNTYASSGNFPRAKSSPAYKDAKKKYRDARAAQILNKEIDDMLAITGGPDPDDDKKKDQMLSKEKLEEMAYNALDRADSEFEHMFDNKFREATSKNVGSKITSKDYDKYMEQVLKDVEKSNAEIYAKAQQRAAELAKYKKTPEYAERLQKAADNYLNSSLYGKGSPEAKARYADYKLKQGEKLIGKENLSGAVAGRGSYAEQAAKELEKIEDWKKTLPQSDLPKLHTEGMDAETFKGLRDGLSNTLTDMKMNSTVGEPPMTASKQMKIDTAADVIAQKQ